MNLYYVKFNYWILLERKIQCSHKVCIQTGKFVKKNKNPKIGFFSLFFGQVRHMDLGILEKKTKMKMKVQFLS